MKVLSSADNPSVSPKVTVLLLVCAAEVLGNSARFNFSAVLTILKSTWGMSNTQAGMVISSLQVGYILAVVVVGHMADRFRARMVFVLCTFWVALANGLFGILADGFLSALVLRGLTGVGLAGIYAPGMKIVSEWFPSQERGKAMGIFVGSVVLGSALSFLLGSVIETIGWRGCVLLTSAGSLLAGLIMLFLIVDRPKTPSMAAPRPRVSIAANKTLALMNLGYVSHMWELYGVWGWIAPFAIYSALAAGLTAERSTSIGSTVAFLIMASGALSNIVAGAVSDRAGRTRTIIAFMTVSSLCSFVIGFLPGIPLVWLALFGLVYGFFLIGDSSVFSTGVTELSPSAHIGAALGLQSSLGYAVTVVSPVAFGALLDRFGWATAFVSLGCGALIGPIAMAYLRTLPDSAKLAGGKR